MSLKEKLDKFENNVSDRIGSKIPKAMKTKPMKVMFSILAGITALSVISELTYPGKLDMTDPIADSELRHLNGDLLLANIVQKSTTSVSADVTEYCEFRDDGRKYKEKICHQFNYGEGHVKSTYITPGWETWSQVTERNKNDEESSSYKNYINGARERTVNIFGLKGDDKKLAKDLLEETPMYKNMVPEQQTAFKKTLNLDF